MAKKRKVQVGDIYAIPLSNDTYAFARVHYDGVLGFYKQRKISKADFDMGDEYDFFTDVYDYILEDEIWTFMTNIPFETEEDSYPPDRCVVDALTGELSLYHLGEIIEAPYEMCKDLEVVAVWDEIQIVDRLMGDDSWHRDMKVPHF